jgi:hypothetical protein
MMRKRGWQCGAVFALLAVTAPVYLRAIRPEHHWGGDFSVHVSQARNLVEHRPIYESTYIVTPESALNHPAAYPPLPSLLLAPVYAAFGLDYRALKLALGVFAWLAMPLWYWVGRRMGLPAAAAGIAVLVFAWGAAMFPLLDSVGSDGLYLFCSAASLLALLWVEQEGWAERRPVAAAMLASGLLLLSVATRAAGMALAVAFGLWEAARAYRERRIRPYALSSGGVLAAALFLYERFLFSGTSHYGGQFSVDPRLIARNLLFYLRLAAPLWSSAPALLRYLLAGLVIALGAAALIRRGRHWSVVEVYFLVYSAVIGLYTANNDFRYSMPLLPLLLFLAADTLLYWSARLVPARPAAAAVGVAGLALVGSAFNVARLETGALPDGVGKPSFRQLTAFLAETPLDTLILSWNPRVFALYTRRPSALYPQAAQNFESQIPPAAHVLLVEYAQPLDREKLGRYLASTSGRLLIEFSNAEFKVYRIR